MSTPWLWSTVCEPESHQFLSPENDHEKIIHQWAIFQSY